MSATRNRVRSLIDRHGLRLKKKLGQNFLIDDAIIRKIVDAADITSDSLVVEIGPGVGNMTTYLLERAGHVLAYEVDRDLASVLQNEFEEHPRLTLIVDDVLKRRLDDDLEKLLNSFEEVVVVANLPYYITTPFLMKALEEARHIDRYILTLQLEVAKRLTAEKGSKDYNALSVIIHHLTDPQFLFSISQHVFLPKPEVKSGVIHLDVRSDHAPAELETFFDFVRSSFKQRRKTLLNNLHKGYTIPKDSLQNFLQKQGLDPRVRAESLSPADLKKLADAFVEYFFS